METNLTRNHEAVGSIPGLNQWAAVSCGIGRRCGSDLALLWLWCRPVAVALSGPLAWEPPYAAGVVLKSKTNRQTNKKLVSLQSQAKEGLEPLEAGRGNDGPSPRDFRGDRLANTLILDFWPPESWENTFLLF